MDFQCGGFKMGRCRDSLAGIPFLSFFCDIPHGIFRGLIGGSLVGAVAQDKMDEGPRSTPSDLPQTKNLCYA